MFTASSLLEQPKSGEREDPWGHKIATPPSVKCTVLGPPTIGNANSHSKTRALHTARSADMPLQGTLQPYGWVFLFCVTRQMK